MITGSQENQDQGTNPSESAAAAMIEASPEGMLLCDELGVILVANAQLELLFGRSRSELVGQPVELLIPDRFRDVHVAHRTNYRASPTVRAMASGLDLTGQRADGTEFPLEVSLSPVTIDGNMRVVATVRDITARVATEAHTHAVLHTIDEASDGVFMFPPDTLCFVYVNQGAVHQLGYSQDELLEMTPIHIKPDFTEQDFRTMLEPLLAGEVDSHMFTTRHRKKNGVDIPVEISIEFPPPAGRDHPRLLVALVRDITDRIRTEQAIRAQQAQLQVLEDRERLAQDLHDVVIQRIFAAGMNLQAALGLITNPELSDRVDQTITQLDETIAELRNRIFYLNSRPPVAGISQLETIVAHAASTLDHLPTLTVEGDPALIPSEVHTQLLPVLTEALSNVARHAKASSTRVTIIIDDGVCLTVSDDGVGMAPTPNRGNGLVNLQARARQVGGSTSVTSNAEGGTTLVWTSGPTSSE